MADDDTETDAPDTEAAPTGWLAPEDRAGAVAALDALGSGAPPPTPAPGPAPEIEMPNETGNLRAGAKTDNAFGDVGRARRDLEAAQEQAEADVKSEAEAGFKATADLEARKATVLEKHAANLADIEANAQRQRAAAEKAASAETAAWMESMDRQAAAEPSPGRWWENTDKFGKALWLMGLAFGQRAQALGAHTNPAVDMIKETVKEDMQSQRDRIARQMETLRLRGQVMSEEHKQKLNDLADDYTHEITRYNALKDAALARAAVSGSLDEQHAMAKAATWIDTNIKVPIATARMKDAVDERNKGIEIGAANARQKASEDAAMERLKIEEEGKDRRAEEAASLREQLAAEKVKGGADKYIPFGGDQYTVVPKGAPADAVGRPFRVHEKAFEKTVELAQAGQAQLPAMTKLRDALKSESSLDDVFNRDPAVRQAFAALVDPITKQMGGRLNKDTIGAMGDIVEGRNPNSAWQRIAGPNRDAIIAVIDNEIREHPARMAAKMGFASDIAPNEELRIKFPDTNYHEPPPPSGADAQAAALNRPVRPVHLTGSEDVADFGAAAEAQMPRDLAGIVEHARSTLHAGMPPDELREVKADAMKAISAWESSQHALVAPDMAHDARLLVEDEAATIGKAADAIRAIKLKIDLSEAGGGHVNLDDIRKLLDRFGVPTTSPAEQKDLLDYAKSKDLYPR